MPRTASHFSAAESVQSQIRPQHPTSFRCSLLSGTCPFASFGPILCATDCASVFAKDLRWNKKLSANQRLDESASRNLAWPLLPAGELRQAPAHDRIHLTIHVIICGRLVTLRIPCASGTGACGSHGAVLLPDQTRGSLSSLLGLLALPIDLAQRRLTLVAWEWQTRSLDHELLGSALGFRWKPGVERETGGGKPQAKHLSRHKLQTTAINTFPLAATSSEDEAISQTEVLAVPVPMPTTFSMRKVASHLPAAQLFTQEFLTTTASMKGCEWFRSPRVVCKRPRGRPSPDIGNEWHCSF